MTERIATSRRTLGSWYSANRKNHAHTTLDGKGLFITIDGSSFYFTADGPKKKRKKRK